MAASGDHHQAPQGIAVDELNAAQQNIDIQLKLSGDAGDQRLGGAPLQVVQPEQVVPGVQPDGPGGVVQQLLNPSEVRGTVHKPPGNGLPGRGKNLEYVSLFHHPAILHHIYLMADLFHHLHLMGDDHDGDAQSTVDLLQQPEDGTCSLRVQGAGGLVAEQYLRVVGQSPGDSHPLLLSPGQLGGVGLRFVGQPHQFQQRLHLPVDLLFALALQGVGHVAVHRPGGEEVEVLEDHADLFPLFPELLFAQCGELVAAHGDGALSGPLQQVDAPGQGGLARPGEANDSGDGPLFNVEGHILYRVHRLLSRLKPF